MRTVKVGEDPNGILKTNLTDKETSWELAVERKWHKLFAEHCRTHNGIGLAANQVGFAENFFFVGPSAKMPKNMGGGLCINPRYEPVRDDQGSRYPLVTAEEGCLSLPGRRFMQARHPVIQAIWVNTTGHTVSAILRGLAARVFQHEYDHLRGLTLLDTAEREITGGGGK